MACCWAKTDCVCLSMCVGLCPDPVYLVVQQYDVGLFDFQVDSGAKSRSLLLGL